MKYKWLVFIPVVIFFYLVYVNLLPFGGIAIYTIDVGTDDLNGTAKLTGPVDRISQPDETNGITFRSLQQGLVYFDLKSPYLKEKGEVAVKVIFRDNFPQGQRFLIGAKNNESRSYAWKEIYVPFYEDLKGYPSVKIDNKQVYLINGNKISSFDEMPDGSVIAANIDINQSPYIEMVENTGKNLKINVTLRESHTFYTYVDDGAVHLNISKQDLNRYNGTDELKIEVYNDNDKLAGNGTIPDDGNKNKSNVPGVAQKANFTFSNLENGVYRIKLIGGGDLLIREIEIDKGKLVAEKRLFLAGDNPADFKGKNLTPIEIYFKNPGNSTLRFQTAHTSGFQNITVNNGILKIVTINKTKTLFNVSLESSKGLNYLISERGDVSIDSRGYFSLTEDSYFTPMKYKILSLKQDREWIRDNLDYVILEYNFPEGKDWKVGNVSWDVDELYIKADTLSFSFNVPHLGKKEFQNYTIPVDMIEIQVKLPPIWERI